MKKFCSKCGNQLDLGKKNCPSCQAFNPYFIAGFTDTVHPEVVHNTLLQKELLLAKEQSVANEAALHAEQLERERVEQNLKNELLKVKEETEQYKQETLNLVIGVQKELHDIDMENKLLKEKVQQLNSTIRIEQAQATAPEITNAKPKSSNPFAGIAAIVLVVLIGGFSYFALSKGNGKVVTTSAATPQPVTAPTATNEAVKKFPPAINPSTNKLLAFATPAATKPVSPAPITAPIANKPNNTPFSLTASRAIGDLVGKKLAGCDITINSASEIDHLDNLVLVEKLSASYFKYKCTVKIKQGSETYTASPYIYYSAEGAFIKVDGTNCE